MSDEFAKNPQCAVFQGQSDRGSFYAETVANFLKTDCHSVVGHLSSRHVAFHASVEVEQVRAWEREIAILRVTLEKMGNKALNWWVLIEVPLLRLGKRLDAVVLIQGIVVVIEFKIRAAHYEADYITQTELYAQSLRDFHAASQEQLIIPVLCAEAAPQQALTINIIDGVADLLKTNAEFLPCALELIAQHEHNSAESLDARAFDASPYRPTPTIVEAAQTLYAGHEIADIGRGGAADAELRAAAGVLRSVASRAESEKRKVVCFVTGTPGAGKTLLGLDLALTGRTGTEPATLLSGNRPLVHVLTEALATDSVKSLTRN